MEGAFWAFLPEEAVFKLRCGGGEEVVEPGATTGTERPRGEKVVGTEAVVAVAGAQQSGH